MNARRIIYIIALAIVAVVLYYSGNNNQYLNNEPVITRETILNEFKDFAGHQKESKSLVGDFKTTDIFFPADFDGYQGDEFYVTVQDGQTIATLKYVIKEKVEKSAKTTQLEYRLKDTWRNFKPPQGKFETYHLQGNKWVGNNK
ncbi:MAG: hypothetical protein ABFC94_03020 [Syntrophomonas sp.]